MVGGRGFERRRLKERELNFRVRRSVTSHQIYECVGDISGLRSETMEAGRMIGQNKVGSSVCCFIMDYEAKFLLDGW
jgi:hypothetical protein